MAQELSPITGIIEEDKVYVDFGEHEGKSILEIADTQPDFYEFLIERKTLIAAQSAEQKIKFIDFM